MIKPVNGHLLIEPLTHEGFMASQRETYEEIGIVVNTDGLIMVGSDPLPRGSKVYFDSWLAAKYPKDGGGADDFYWLVKWEDIRAIEYVEPEIPKQ